MSEAARSLRLAERPALSEAAHALIPPVVAAPLDPLDGIPKTLMARASAKAGIVAAFRTFRNRSCRTLNATGALFVESYNLERERIGAATRELYPTIEWPTLQRDWRRFEKSGIAGLIPGYKGGKRIFDCNPPMRDFAIALIAHNPRVRAGWVLSAIKVRFPNDRIPNLRSIERFLRDWKAQNRSLFQRIADPDGWKNRHMLALGDADAGITRVNQRWEIDGTKSDAFVWIKDVKVVIQTRKMQMMSVIDVFSRRKISHLAPAESSQAVADLLIKAFIILGIPDEIVSDRGAAFLSARTQRAMDRLGIKWTAVRAYSGEKKPFVERGAMGSVLHMFFENLPGYSGHSPAEASAIRKRKSFAQRRGQDMAKLYRVELTAPELQTLLDQYLEHIDGNRKQAGHKPNEVFAEAERRGQVRRIADDRLLDLILGEDGIAVIGKKGLRVSNAFYWDDALIEHTGQTVQYVRTRDAGKLIVYTADAKPRFVCLAVDPEAVGLDREVMAIAGKQRQAAVMREGMDELRALKRKHRPEKMFREIIDHAAARAAVRIPAESNIEPLPYRSPALEAAAAALEALDAPAESVPHSEAELREGDLAMQELEHRSELRAQQLTDDECDALWIGIRRERRALTAREQAFLARYGHSPEGWADIYETTDEFRALLRREGWSGREGQGTEREKTACKRKSA